MIIVPKVDENWIPCEGPILDALRISRILEIQMLSKHIRESFVKCTKLLDNLLELTLLTNVILHMPLGLHELEYAAANTALRYETYDLFVQTDIYGRKHGVVFHVLFHVHDSMQRFVGFGGMELLHTLVKADFSTRVLLENSTRSITLDKDKPITLEQLFSQFSDPKLGMCLDICHLQSSENAYSRTYSLNSEQLQNIRSLHFSCTLNGDGYKFKSNHGQPHPTLTSVFRDLKYLQNKGVEIDKVWMVLEVAEEDYVNRPNLISEIQLLQKADSFRR